MEETQLPPPQPLLFSSWLPPPDLPGSPLPIGTRHSLAATLSIVSGAAAWAIFVAPSVGTQFSTVAFAVALKLSLLAIGLGVAGLDRSKQPATKGRGMAIAGLTLGLLPYALPPLLLMWLILNGTNPLSG